MANAPVLAMAMAVALSSGAFAQSFDDKQLAYDVAQAAPSPARGDVPEKPVSVAAQIEAQREPQPVSGGGGVDTRDPTANVQALLRAAVQRQDDLREGSERFILLSLQNNEKMDELRFEMSKQLRTAETTRVDDLAIAEAKRIDQLAEAEAKRIDAIRTVDVNAVAVANQRAVEQASVLSQNVTASADTLRSLVANTATTVAAAQEQSTSALSTKIDQAFTGLQTRVAALEQAQYVGQGRQTLSDPALLELTAEVKALASKQNVNTGESAGSASTISYIFAALGALGVLIGIASAAVAFARRPPVPNGNGNGQKVYA